MTESMADLTLEQRNAALTTWLNDLTTVYEKCAAERDAQTQSASYLAGKLADVDRERLALREALRALLDEPYGCSLCDAGRPCNPDKGHQPDCPYEHARALLEARP